MGRGEVDAMVVQVGGCARGPGAGAAAGARRETGADPAAITRVPTSLEPEPLLQISGLHVTYPSAQGPVRAVRGVNLTVAAGSVVGLAGESGCGKSTLAGTVLRMHAPDVDVRGQVLLGGEDVLTMSWGRLRAVRWAQAAVVFQGGLHSLDPVQRIGRQIAEPVLLHRPGTTRRAAAAAAGELLERVGLPAGRAGWYPHQLSGGQRQRVLIAMALACSPRLLVADEPTTALDTMAQAQILDLLTGLVRDLGLGLLLVGHDLALLGSACDRVALMYAGRIVEEAPGAAAFADARHPYGRALSAAFTTLGDPAARRSPRGLAGEPPFPGELAGGCAFAPRCGWATPECSRHDPPLEPAGPRRSAACLHLDRHGHRRLDLHVDRHLDRHGHPLRLPGQVPDPGGVARRSPTGDQGTPTAGRRAAPDATRAGPRNALRRESAQAGPPVPSLRLRTLSVHFGGPRKPVRAVDGVDLSVRPGEIVALAGESGCGKTTLARTVLGLERPTAGEVLVDGTPLGRGRRELATWRRRAHLIPQDALAALDPRRTVREAIAEGIRIQQVPGDEPGMVAEALERAGLRPAGRFLDRYPHELSGGQRQRVLVAAALVLRPQLLVADEPVSSLDASVRGEILALLLALRDDLGLGILLITHDLGVAWAVADRLAVMYQGRLVEVGPTETVVSEPRHPYTRALLSVVPGSAAGERILLRGEPPAPGPPSGTAHRRTPL